MYWAINSTSACRNHRIVFFELFHNEIQSSFSLKPQPSQLLHWRIVFSIFLSISIHSFLPYFICTPLRKYFYLLLYLSFCLPIYSILTHLSPLCPLLSIHLHHHSIFPKALTGCVGAWSYSAGLWQPRRVGLSASAHFGISDIFKLIFLSLFFQINEILLNQFLKFSFDTVIYYLLSM